MKITWNGHACFTLESEDGTVVFDPFKDGSVEGYAPLRLKADTVLCSHSHGDHNAVECVELTGGNFGGEIDFFDSYHDNVKGVLRGKNRVHIIKTEGMKAVHLGDLGCGLKSAELEKIQGCDLLMIPIGGVFTINSKQALALIEEIKPKTVIPMHFKGEGFGYGVLESRDGFVEKAFNPTVYPSCTAELTKDTPAQTVVFTR